MRTVTLYAVIYGNYFPREIDTIWGTITEAEDRVAVLGGMWEVEEMTCGVDLGKEEKLEEKK